MLYFVNLLTVQLFLIVVLASVRKLTDLIRKLHKKWIELDDDPRFNLDCGCQDLLKDTPTYDVQLQAPVRFTQVNLPALRFRRRSSSRKSTWAWSSFRQENVAADRRDFPPPPPPVLNLGPKAYDVWQPPTFGTEAVAALLFGFPRPPPSALGG